MVKKEKKESVGNEKGSEIRGLLWLLGCILLSISYLSFSFESKNFNSLGALGHLLGWTLSYLFGFGSLGILFYFGWKGWNQLLGKPLPKVKTYTFFIFLLSCCMLLNGCAQWGIQLPQLLMKKIYSETVFLASPYPHHEWRHNFGGVPLYFLYRDLGTFHLQRLLGDFGVAFVFSASALISFLLLTEAKILPLLEKLARLFRGQNTPFPPEAAVPENEMPAEIEEEEERIKKIYSPTWSVKKSSVVFGREAKLVKEELSYKESISSGTYTLPPLSLLNPPRKIDAPHLKRDLKKQAEILEETLMSFGIEAKVGDIHCGPTITSFEVHPAVGVKVQKITALENDIALNLQAKAIRIIAPIPGKAAVGVEIPALVPQEVSFRELLGHYQTLPRKFFIPILLGKTVSGDFVMNDLARMPHAIIAGATGSGKSVCINTIVMSILMNSRPDEIKLLMVDPKKVELTCYSDLPHLLAPVITEAHGAYAALNWLVKEMQQRYDILKQLGLRNIGAFNHRTINRELESSLTIAIPEKMPGIVAIIDEFADLMMVSSSDLETPVARIAQMARAVGIHLILATQRPSREVITGLIKANFPTRIAFKVASRVNSQIILDENGAESLLGNGDLLFLPPGTSSLIRAQGAFVSDEEINRVVRFICDQAPPNYLISSFDSPQTHNDLEEGSKDALFDQARMIVVDTGTASTTFLQRKLKIGYARAASLMDELESRGIIGPQEGARPRRVLHSESHKRDED